MPKKPRAHTMMRMTAMRYRRLPMSERRRVRLRVGTGFGGLLKLSTEVIKKG
jgi:hypothetical protein